MSLEKTQGEIPSLFFSLRFLSLNLYPHHYSTAFAFSLIPYLPPRRRALRRAFPHPLGVRGREDVRFTTFRRHN